MEKVETVSDFIFLGSKIATDSDCSHEIKRRLLLERKVGEKRKKMSIIPQVLKIESRLKILNYVSNSCDTSVAQR